MLAGLSTFLVVFVVCWGLYTFPVSNNKFCARNPMIKRKRIAEISIVFTLLGIGFAYWAYSEVTYARQKTPTGISTVADFFDRFDVPAFAREIELNGQLYIELVGPLPPRWSIALPSGRPAYVFDAKGNFIDWCSDPGDAPSWRDQWPISDATPISIDEVRTRFNIPT